MEIKVGQTFEIDLYLDDIIINNCTFSGRVIPEWGIVLGEYNSIYGYQLKGPYGYQLKGPSCSWAMFVYDKENGGKVHLWYNSNSLSPKTLLCSNEQRGIKIILEPENLIKIRKVFGEQSNKYFNELQNIHRI